MTNKELQEKTREQIKALGFEKFDHYYTAKENAFPIGKRAVWQLVKRCEIGEAARCQMIVYFLELENK